MPPHVRWHKPGGKWKISLEAARQRKAADNEREHSTNKKQKKESMTLLGEAVNFNQVVEKEQKRKYITSSMEARHKMKCQTVAQTESP